MDLLTGSFIGLSWLINLVLDGGAAYYCYRITKVTGGFRAWWLLIGFTIVFAVSSFTSVSYSVVYTQATGTISSSNVDLTGTALVDVVLSLVMSVLLFTAMFELNRTFRRVQK